MKWISLLLFAVIVFLPGCTAFKSVKCGPPSVNTYLNFPLDTIAANKEAKAILISSQDHNKYFEDSKFTGGQFHDETIDEYFSKVRGNGTLLIVRNDTILLEKYYGDFTPESRSNIFSVTKAITALLCGIAADDGFLSIYDPVTKYIPELETADSLFKQLTIAHLLDMRTGLDFKEDYGWNPFSKMARLYYGDNVVSQFGKLHFKEAPGASHYYNSMATALLGVVIERATGEPFSSYMEREIWKPLDMEADAYISLDDKKHRQAKAYGGLVTNVRDLAKIGQLYINGGIHNGHRIVCQEWIDRSTHASLENEAYSFGWNNIITRVDGRDVVTSRFFVLGLYGQVLFCDSEQNIVFVTLGENKGTEYHLLFDSLCDILRH